MNRIIVTAIVTALVTAAVCFGITAMSADARPTTHTFTAQPGDFVYFAGIDLQCLFVTRPADLTYARPMVGRVVACNRKSMGPGDSAWVEMNKYAYRMSKAPVPGGKSFLLYRAP